MAKSSDPPVHVSNEDPIPITPVEPPESADHVRSDGPRAFAANTEASATKAKAGVDAAILRTEDQRRISNIWERTQQVIALSVVEAGLFIVGVLVLTPSITALRDLPVPEFAVTASVAGMLFLTGVANLVIGFYFGRTNHQRVGGDVTTGEGDVGR